MRMSDEERQRKVGDGGAKVAACERESKRAAETKPPRDSSLVFIKAEKERREKLLLLYVVHILRQVQCTYM